MKSALLSFLTEIPNALRIAAGQGADVRTAVRRQVRRAPLVLPEQRDPRERREQPDLQEPPGQQARQEELPERPAPQESPEQQALQE